MLLTVRVAASYEFDAETFVCMMAEPLQAGTSHRMVRKRFTTSPRVESELGRDMYGNYQRRLVASAGEFSFEFTARIETSPNRELPVDAFEHPVHEIPPELLTFMLPSRYCQCDQLSRMASSEFGHLPPGGGRVRAIAEWVRLHVEYQYGMTDSMTSALDTATERIGVCRDFAHLVIAFCRALNIPARYVAGYALGLDPPDFHGYAEVYMGGDWYNVDATFEKVRPALIPIAVGRDAADVAMMTTWTPHKLITQSVEVRPAT